MDAYSIFAIWLWGALSGALIGAGVTVIVAYLHGNLSQ